jgi:hypothetical protein
MENRLRTFHQWPAFGNRSIYIYTILHQRTVPYTHIDRSSEETAIPDFAEDDVNDLLELLLTL